MTLPPVARVFFAIAIPYPIQSQLDVLMAELKKRSKTNTIRWTRLENLHITLQFLAKVQAAHIDMIVTQVRQQLNNIVWEWIGFDQLYFYPSAYRPRILALGVTPQAPLVKLAHAIGEGIKLSGYEIEDKPYRAHLTLGRVKQMQGINPTMLLQTACVINEKIDLNEVTLFRSDPHEEGTTYTVLTRIPLTAPIAQVQPSRNSC